MPSPRPPTGVLVMRAWIEDHPTGLRVVVTYALDPAAGPSVVRSAASEEDACQIVRDWLSAVVEDR